MTKEINILLKLKIETEHELRCCSDEFNEKELEELSILLKCLKEGIRARHEEDFKICAKMTYGLVY